MDNHNYPASPAQRDRQQRAFDSPANRQLNLLYGLLKAADHVAHWWLADHPAGCGCDFCGGLEAHARSVRYDVGGVEWSAEMAAASVESAIHRFFDLDAPTLGEDLRRLVALADEVDPPDADAPAIAEEVARA